MLAKAMLRRVEQMDEVEVVKDDKRLVIATINIFVALTAIVGVALVKSRLRAIPIRETAARPMAA